MTGFTRHRRSGRALATFSGFEADLLRSLASQVVELLRDGAPQTGPEDPLEAMLDLSGPTAAPDDPVLARLLPSAYPGDDEASGEFRRYTESSLREAKSRAAGVIIEGLESAGLPAELTEDGLVIDVELEPDEAQGWLRGLTDIRLALATRLGITEEDEEAWEQVPDEDPRKQAHDIYDWVGYLQETLVQAVAGYG